MLDVFSILLGIGGTVVVPVVLLRALFGPADLAALFASPWSGPPRGSQEPDLLPFRFRAACGEAASTAEGAAADENPSLAPVRGRVGRARPYVSR